MRWILGIVVAGFGLAVGLGSAMGGGIGSGGTTPPATPTASTTTALGGVAINPEGVLAMRRVGPVAVKRGEASVTYVSLPRALAEWKLAAEGGKVASKDVRFLHGLTRIEYVFVYPDAHDVVLAGPSEPMRDDSSMMPVGTVTGRPVVQLEDLIVAMRAVEANGGRSGGGGGSLFGCSLDLAPGAQAIATEVGQKFANAPRAQLAAELKRALGQQQVRILGVPADTRMALAMVCTDYRLKRMSMGLDQAAGVGNALGGGLVANRVWFEPAYEPMMVSSDGLSYQLRGPRLKVLAGAQEFDSKGATAEATAFAKRFSSRMEEVAGRMDAVADLQNITDVLVVAALIRQDELARKAGLDFSWVMEAEKFRVAVTPVPREAETLVNDTATMLVQGGVKLESRVLASVERGKDEKGAVAAARLRPEEGWFVSKPASKMTR